MGSVGKGACWRRLCAKRLPGPRGSIDQEWIASAAMLTMVNSVKTLTKSVSVSLLDNQNRTQAGQGTWKCGLPAEFIDEDQMTLQELTSLKRMPRTTLDGNHHNRQV